MRQGLRRSGGGACSMRIWLIYASPFYILYPPPTKAKIINVHCLCTQLINLNQFQVKLCLAPPRHHACFICLFEKTHTKKNEYCVLSKQMRKECPQTARTDVNGQKLEMSLVVVSCYPAEKDPQLRV